jgi:PAS domain S-box-containing protein
VSAKNLENSVERSAPDKRLEFERLLVDFSARFVALPPEKVDDEISNALKEVLEFFSIDRCALLRLLPGKTSWLVTHNAAAGGIPLYPIRTPTPISIVPWIARKLAVEREAFSFARLEELPEEAATDKRTLDKFEIQSALFIPIAALRSSEYSVSISSAEKDRTYPEEYISQLRLLGEVFVNALERSMGEQALRESEERLNLAASAAEAGLWMMEMERGIVWATPKLRELLLFEPDEELPFDRFVAVVHPDDRARVRMLVLKSLEGQEALNMEYRIVQPDGMIRWISSRGNPPSVGSGLAKRLTGVSVDVTERKKMEQELRERLNEIERLKLQLEKENLYLREEIKTGKGFQKIVGNSEALQYVFFRVQQVAPTDATVLVLGETGTGKGMAAHAVHEMSARKDKPMITVNCAALPANLIESELFGREKGAFTGAHARQVGRFEVANGGTIFLDEIGEMPLELQAKLLRVLQDGEFERLGSPRTVKVDVRVIASTSRDLKAEVHNHRFREDLFYRLNVFPISMPPLRMRADDISELVGHFVNKYARKIGRQIKTVPKSTIKSLQAYSWPGNVRELEHVIERAVITSAGPVLRLADRLEGEPVEAKEDLLKDLVAVEREHILKVLRKTRWKIDGVRGAASLLGLHPSTLRFRIKKLGIERP